MRTFTDKELALIPDDLVIEFKRSVHNLNDVTNKISNIINAHTKAIQEVCDHNWQYEGHSHNDDLYTCIKCKKDKWK